MIRIFSFLLVILLYSCNKDDKPVKTDITLLPGKWKILEIRNANKLYPEYFKELITINTSNGEVLWRDTVHFGKPVFGFSTGNILNSFSISREKVRSLQGYWEANENNDSVRIVPAVTASMTGDTIINSRRFSFYNFLPVQFKIKTLNSEKLVLTNGAEELVLQKE